MIHSLADVKSINIGNETNIWQFCVILAGAKIGANCNISCNCFIENDVIIGDNVTIKSGVQIWDGLTIENDVFIGPNVTFTNDLLPRSKAYPMIFEKTILKKGCSVGANSTIIAGISIGHFSMIGAGSVLTKSTPSFTLWYGNPAVHKGYITKNGIVLNMDFVDQNTGYKYHFINEDLILKDD